MKLGDAFREFAELLRVGSSALRDVTREETKQFSGTDFRGLQQELEDIALRLEQIGREFE